MESSLESGPRAEWVIRIVPSLTPPQQTVSQCSKEGFLNLVNTYGSASYNITGEPRQRNMAQMKEQIKTTEKELSDEET